MVDNRRFEECICEIDRSIDNHVKSWTEYLPRPIDRLPFFEKLQKHIMYVIMSFLKEENCTNSPQELFIQIPVEELANLGNKGQDKLQRETFQKTAGTIAACLLISTINKSWQKIQMPPNITYRGNNNDWYQIGDHFYVNHPNKGGIILKCDRNNNGNRRLTYTIRGRQYLIDDDFIRACRCNIYKIIPTARPSVADLQDQINILTGLLQSSENSINYNSAAFVHIGRYFPINEKVPVDSRYFDFLRYENNISSIKRTDHTDIIVTLGDSMYVNRRQEFRQRAFKKIIYIGSESPAEGIPVYSFSYRETYRYCAPRNCNFKEPQMIRNIEFPWMDDKLDELHDLLDNLSGTDESLTDDVKTKIIRIFRSRFSSIDFCKKYWEEEKYNVEIDIDCASDTIDAIKEWCEQLEYDSDTNPKAKIIANLHPRPDLVYDKYWRKHLVYDNRTQSFKKDSKIRNRYVSELKNLSGENNHILIDCATYSSGNNDYPLYKAYKHLLKNHLYAHVTALYYRREDEFAKGLLWFLNKEFDCYDSDMRHKYNTSINRNQITDKVETVSDQIFTLADFQDANESHNRWSDSESRQTIVTFSDGREERIDGDVLVIDGGTIRRERIQIFEDEEFEGNEVEILYYKTPDNFDQFMTAYFNFPEGADIKHFEDLWKNALRKYVSGGNRREMIEKICNETHIEKNKIRRYLNEKCSNKFLGSRREMRRMCLFLSQEGSLPEGEITWVMAAKKAYDEYKPTGGRLKDEVLEAKRGHIIQNGILRRISTHLSISIDNVVDRCLDSGTISNVKID